MIKQAKQENNTVTEYATVGLLIVLFFFIYFLYHNAITAPLLGDSHDYHIPIAKSILDGSFLHLPNHLNPSIYYPGSSNAILALFIFLHLPVNYFCLLGWVILFFLCRKLGEHFGLKKSYAVLFATTFITTTSVLRQVITQSIDMWIAVFFVWSILLLENQKPTIQYFLLVGFSLGMIIGSKFSGPFFVVLLLLVYGRALFAKISISRIFAFLLPFSIFGLFWYVRNAVLYHNPLYPAHVLFLKGYPKFPLQDMALWKTPIYEHNGLIALVVAFISEYLLWGLSFIPIIIYLVVQIKNKSLRKQTQVHRVLILTGLTCFVSLFLPIPTLHIISNMRYLFPLFILLILSVFLIAKEYQLDEHIALLALINTIMGLWYTAYYPKLIVIYLVIVMLLLWKKKHTLDHLLVP